MASSAPILIRPSSAGAHHISLRQHGPNRFTVTYGEEVKDRLNYSAAAKQIGECILHAMACEGALMEGA